MPVDTPSRTLLAAFADYARRWPEEADVAGAFIALVDDVDDPFVRERLAGLAGDAAGQLGQFAARRAVGVGINGGGEFVIADVENSLRSHGPGRQTAEQGHGQLEKCFQEIDHWLALFRQACAGVALLSMRHLAVT